MRKTRVKLNKKDFSISGTLYLLNGVNDSIEISDNEFPHGNTVVYMSEEQLMQCIPFLYKNCTITYQNQQFSIN